MSNITEKGKTFIARTFAGINFNEEKNKELKPNILSAEINFDLKNSIKDFFEFQDLTKMEILNIFPFESFFIIFGNYENNGWFVIINLGFEILKGFKNIEVNGVSQPLEKIFNVFVDKFDYIYLININDLNNIFTLNKINDIFSTLNNQVENEKIFPIISLKIMDVNSPISPTTNQPIFRTLEKLKLNLDNSDSNLLNLIYYYKIPTGDYPNKFTFWIQQLNMSTLENVFSNEISLSNDAKYKQFINMDFDFFTNSNINLADPFLKSNIFCYVNGTGTSTSTVRRFVKNQSFTEVMKIYNSLKNNPNFSNFQMFNEGTTIVDNDIDNLELATNVRISQILKDYNTNYYYTNNYEFNIVFLKNKIPKYVSNTNSGILNGGIAYIHPSILYPENKFSWNYNYVESGWKNAYPTTNYPDASWIRKYITNESYDYGRKTHYNWPTNPPSTTPTIQEFSYNETITINSEPAIILIRIEKNDDNQLIASSYGYWNTSTNNINEVFSSANFKDEFYFSARIVNGQNSNISICKIKDFSPSENKIELSIVNNNFAINNKLKLSTIYDDLYGLSLIGFQNYNFEGNNYFNSIILYYQNDYSILSGVNNSLQETSLNVEDYFYSFGIRENNLIINYNFNLDLTKCLICVNSYGNGDINADPYFFIEYQNQKQNTNISRITSDFLETGEQPITIFDNNLIEFAKNNNNLIFSSEIKNYQMVNSLNNNWSLVGNTNFKLFEWTKTISKYYNQIVTLNFDLTINIIDNLNNNNVTNFKASSDFADIFIEQNSLMILENKKITNMVLNFEGGTKQTKNIEDYIFINENNNTIIQISIFNNSQKTINSLDIVNNSGIVLATKNVNIPANKILNFEITISII